MYGGITMKILVVEDNESVCTMLEMFFASEGYKATFVYDGQDGFNYFNKEKWDLIIWDCLR